MNENNLLQEISCKIQELEHLHVRRENMCMTMSNLVFSVLFTPQIESAFNVSHASIKTYEGVEVNSFHPYNEIVIYDKNLCGYDDKFVRKISVNVSKHNNILDTMSQALTASPIKLDELPPNFKIEGYSINSLLKPKNNDAN